VPDDGTCEPKHVALCDVTLKWCGGRHIVVCLCITVFAHTHH